MTWVTWGEILTSSQTYFSFMLLIFKQNSETLWGLSGPLKDSWFHVRCPNNLRLILHLYFLLCLPHSSAFCPKLALVCFLLLSSPLNAMALTVMGRCWERWVEYPVWILWEISALFEVIRELGASPQWQEWKGTGRDRKSMRSTGLYMSEGDFRNNIAPNGGRWASGLQGDCLVGAGCWQLAPVTGNWATRLHCLLAERQGVS